MDRQNYQERDWEAYEGLGQIFSLLEKFANEFPKYFSEVALQDVQSDIKLLMEGWFQEISDQHLANLYELFSDDLHEFKIKESYNPSFSPLEVSNLFYEIREKVARIPKILEQRILIQWVKDTLKNTLVGKNTLKNTLVGKNTLKNTLVEHNFRLKRELVSEKKTLFFVQTPMDTYYFINPNPQKGEKTVFAYGGENFKGSKFGENKIYQFTQKIPWDVEEIQDAARGFSSIRSEASLKDFLASFMSKDLLKEVEKYWILDVNLDVIVNQISMLIHYLNVLGLQEGKIVLYLENAAHELSFLAEWKEIVESFSKIETPFYGKDAVAFKLKQIDGTTVLYVTNGDTTYDFPQ